MPPTITRSDWTASNIPSGLSFDESTGTFSGTPTEEGEYTVPVSVTTYYGDNQLIGSDAKDVRVVVQYPPADYTNKIFVVPVTAVTEGVITRINLRDYFDMLGVSNEHISLADAGITSCSYVIRDNNGDIMETPIIFKSIINNNITNIFTYDYDENTGEFVIIGLKTLSAVSTAQTPRRYLDITTNLGSTQVCFVIHVYTNAVKKIRDA